MEQIRDKVKNFDYKSKSNFVEDVKLIVENCSKYNGESHAITAIARSLYSKFEGLMAEESEKIRLAEDDIRKEESDKNKDSAINAEKTDVILKAAPVLDATSNSIVEPAVDPQKCELTDI